MVAAGGYVYYGSSAEDAVYCLNGETGAQVWRFFTEGPVRLAPTVHGGKVYIGSDDGRVYCLDARTGRSIWTTGPVQPDKRVLGNGRMISLWPVRSGVTVEGRRAYFCGGLFPEQGVYLCAVDADTGKAIWKRKISVSCQGHLLCTEKTLLVPTGRTSLAAFDRATGKALGSVGSGASSFGIALPDMVVQGANERGEIQICSPTTRKPITNLSGLHFIARDNRIAVLGRRSLSAIDREAYLRLSYQIRALEKIEKKKRTPAQHQQLAELVKERKACTQWTTPCAEGTSLIMAGKHLFVGGQGMVSAYEVESGRKTWQGSVTGQAYGLTIARGVLYVSTDKGHIHCFGVGRKNLPDTRQLAEVASPSEANLKAEAILKASDVVRGYGLVLGTDQGQLASALARLSQLNLIGVEQGRQAAQTARDRIHAKGMYGRRVSIHQGALSHLPYQDYFANLVVLDRTQSDGPLEVPASELLRLVHPGGGKLVVVYAADQPAAAQFKDWAKGYFKDVVISRDRHHVLVTARRPALTGVGQWTHLYADPANSSCSGETHTTDALQLAWFGGPGPRLMVDRHHRSMSPLYLGGRLFSYGDNRVIASDAYNGTVLWELPVPGSRRLGMMNDCGIMCVTEDTFYIAADDACWLVDTESGVRQQRFKVPDTDRSKASHWGYIAVDGQQLFGSAQIPGASFAQYGFGNNTVGQIEGDFKLKALSHGLFARDRKTGRLLWHYRKGAILNSAIVVGPDCLYCIETRNARVMANAKGRISAHQFFEKETFLVALDRKTGATAWEHPIVFPYQHQAFLLVAQNQVLVVGSSNVKDKVTYDLYAFNAKHGGKNWHAHTPTPIPPGGVHGEQWQHPAVIGSSLYLTPRTSRTLFTYDLHTGAQSASPRGKWGGCGTISASASHIFYRNANPEMHNLTSQQPIKITSTTRPGCWINILPAGGMVLIPEGSSGCTCAYPIQTSMGFIPVGK